MVKWVKYYLWFIKTSEAFMQGYNPIKIFFQSLYKGIKFSNESCVYDKLTQAEKEAWYLSGEGRTLYYEIGKVDK